MPVCLKIMGIRVAKICIMCDMAAGSKEHVFPAAFGGRRVNRGIYCQPHNEGLGHHVNELMVVLGFFNASLGVRSDHHDEPKPYVFTMADGQRFQRLDESIEYAPPLHLSQTPELIGKKIELSFASTEQRDQWIAQQKKSGYQLDSIETESRTTLFAKPLKQSVNITAEPFHRAVAYLALTHLAHHYPNLARQDSMASVRRCVLGQEAVLQRVWLVDLDFVTIPYDGSLPFSHATVLTLSATTGRAVALVVFFKHLCLAVDLGPVSVALDERVTTLIDPLTELAGKSDIHIIRDALPMTIPTAEQGQEYLRQLKKGERPSPFDSIQAELNRAHSDAFAQDLVPRLLAVNALDLEERRLKVRGVVDESGQRVLNALARSIRSIITYAPFPKVVLDEFQRAIEEDPSTEHGLTERSMEYLQIAKHAYEDQLIYLMDMDALNEGSLLSLFEEPADVIMPAVDAILHAAAEALKRSS